MPSQRELREKLKDIAWMKIDDVPYIGRNHQAIKHARTIAEIFDDRDLLNTTFQKATFAVNQITPGWDIEVQESPLPGAKSLTWFEILLVPPGGTFRGITVRDLVHATRDIQEVMGFPDQVDPSIITHFSFTLK